MTNEIIKIENTTICYPDGYTAIDGVDVSIEEGSSTAIIGANGAGKTTLFRGMLGLQPIKAGRIHMNGFEVLKDNYPAVRKSVGMLFQNPDDQLFQTRVIDDIKYGLLNTGMSEQDMERRADKVIKQLNLEALQNKLTHNLSGGEKRQVAIAGILIMQPKILLMDEPTTYLDPRARRNFIKNMQDIALTKVLITHDFSLIESICDRVILLNKGKLIAKGRTQEILKDEQLLIENGL